MHTDVFFFLPYNESLLPAFVLYIVCTEKSTLGQASILGTTFYPHKIWLTFTVASWFAAFVQETFPFGRNHLEYNTECQGLRESQSSSNGWEPQKQKM